MTQIETTYIVKNRKRAGIKTASQNQSYWLIKAIRENVLLVNVVISYFGIRGMQNYLDDIHCGTVQDIYTEAMVWNS